MKVRVLFFGPARTAAGPAECHASLADPAALSDLVAWLVRNYPSLERLLPVLKYAVNQEFASPDHLLAEGDEVAVIPPVSGGREEEAARLQLTAGPIDTAVVRKLVTGDAAHGAVVTFEGLTRAETHPDHGNLIRLEYQAYEPMAVKEMGALVEAARRRWSIGPCAVVHRVGRVELGEVSVMIAVACPHRAEGFESCRWLIDTLKAQVPIWKCEHWEDGQATWSDPTACRSQVR